MLMKQNYPIDLAFSALLHVVCCFSFLTVVLSCSGTRLVGQTREIEELLDSYVLLFFVLFRAFSLDFVSTSLKFFE